MNDNQEAEQGATIETQEIARQAEVELAILLGIENSLRIALQWMTRSRGNSYKLSTLRFHTWSFERHLTRVKVLAEHHGYLQPIVDANPHLAAAVNASKAKRSELHSELEDIIVRLDHVSGDDAVEFGRICADLEHLLDELKSHARSEGELLQHSFTREQGGSG